MKLKYALRFNAVFSLITGLLLMLASSQTADLFAVQSNWLFLILGISLIFFAVVVYAVSSQKPIHPLYSLIITILDVIWVLASIVIILLNPFGISEMGNVLVGLVALVVFFIAIAQALGITRLDLNADTGRKELQFEREVPFEKAAVWDLLSDVGNYHQVAPNIDNVDIVSGKEKGLVRRCSHGNDTWTETCLNWDEGREFSFRVKTDTPDYPYPLRFLQGTWIVEKNEASKTNIKMIFEFQYKRDAFNLLVHPMMAPKFRNICEELLNNWERMLNNGVAR
jgi:ribosome-associated toxin RatA of RatAB toxin-antitoxin module